MMPPMNAGYPQGNYGMMPPMSTGYSQSNLGQINVYPQGSNPSDKFVSGVEEVNNKFISPGNMECYLTHDWKHLIVKTADQRGYPDMRVFDIQECIEDIPQHNTMANDVPVTRQEFEELKEMVENVQFNGHQQGSGNGGKSNRQSNSRNS